MPTDISSTPGQPAVLYVGPAAGDFVDQWNGREKPIELVAGETVDALPTDVSAKGAIIETTGEAATAAHVDAVKEVVGSGPVLVVHRGTVETLSAILPAGASSQITVSSDCDRSEILDRVAEQVREAIDCRREQAMLDSLLSTFSIDIYFKDQRSRHLAVSNSHIDHIGPADIENPEGNYHQHPDDVIGKTDFDLYSDDVAVDAVDDDQTVLETEEQIVDRIETSYNKEGWKTVVSTTKGPWYDHTGHLRGVVGITRDISQRKQYEDHLKRQNKRLRRLATMVSHDLRNPLSVAFGRLDLAQKTGLDAHFEAVETALSRIEKIIDDVLFVTRQGIAVTDPQQVSISRVAESVWEQMDHEGATFQTTTEASIYADPGRLKLLFEHLFDNAAEHGPSGDNRISITVGDLEDGGFFVADDGVGIPPDKRKAIFEPGLTAADEVGLGLHLVASIADAHAWTVKIVDSETGGARFEFHNVHHIGGVE